MGVEILVPLGLFAMIALIVVIPGWLRSRERHLGRKTKVLCSSPRERSTNKLQYI